MTLTPEQIESAHQRLQGLIKARGGQGLLGLSRSFRLIDLDKSGLVSRPEFFRAISRIRADLTDEEVDALFAKYDVDNSGAISSNEFLRAFRGRMSKIRRALVNRLFTDLDADFSGALTVDKVCGKYEAKNSPEVVNGTKTEAQVLQEFLETFEGHGSESVKGDGQVTQQEWVDYYDGISAGIDHDDQFLVQACSVWHYPYVPLQNIKTLIGAIRAQALTLAQGQDNEVQLLADHFATLDKNKLGELDINEFKQSLVTLGVLSLGFSEDRTTAELLFVLFDEPANGVLPYVQFARDVLTYEFA